MITALFLWIIASVLISSALGWRASQISPEKRPIYYESRQRPPSSKAVFPASNANIGKIMVRWKQRAARFFMR